MLLTPTNTVGASMGGNTRFGNSANPHTLIRMSRNSTTLSEISPHNCIDTSHDDDDQEKQHDALEKPRECDAAGDDKDNDDDDAIE